MSFCLPKSFKNLKTRKKITSSDVYPTHTPAIEHLGDTGMEIQPWMDVENQTQEQ